ANLRANRWALRSCTRSRSESRSRGHERTCERIDGHCAHARVPAASRGAEGMSVLRVMGSETEYGISVPGHPNANAMLTSSQIVNAYATAMQRARRARWDFEEENPL